MESDLKRRTRNTRTQTAILESLEVAGVLAVALVAPNLLSLLKKRYTYKAAYSASARLVEKGLVVQESNGGRRFLRLSAKGQAHLNTKRSLRIQPKTWDGKWRIVSFDIEQKRSAQRTRLRQTLREIGFERLQDSVWVFPYDCEDLITLLKTDYGLGKEVLYIIADTIENDRALRGRFGLKAH